MNDFQHDPIVLPLDPEFLTEAGLPFACALLRAGMAAWLPGRRTCTAYGHGIWHIERVIFGFWAVYVDHHGTQNRTQAVKQRPMDPLGACDAGGR